MNKEKVNIKDYIKDNSIYNVKRKEFVKAQKGILGTKVISYGIDEDGYSYILNEKFIGKDPETDEVDWIVTMLDENAREVYSKDGKAFSKVLTDSEFKEHYELNLIRNGVYSSKKSDQFVLTNGRKIITDGKDIIADKKGYLKISDGYKFFNQDEFDKEYLGIKINKKPETGIYLTIDNINAMSLKDLEILNDHYSNSPIDKKRIKYKNVFYDVNDFIDIRKELNDIKKKIGVPGDEDPNKEKKLFTSAYFTLAKEIDSPDFKNKNKNPEDKLYSSSLYSLLGGNPDSYGDQLILNTLLEDLGIESKIIAHTKNDNLNGDMSYNWMQVKLDGEIFNCDITADRPFINNREKAPFFLKSNEDMKINEYNLFDIYPPDDLYDIADRSFTDEEQKLYGAYARINFEIANLNKNITNKKVKKYEK